MAAPAHPSAPARRRRLTRVPVPQPRAHDEKVELKNILRTIGGFFGRAANAVAVAVGIGKQVAPYVRAAREVSPLVDAYVDKLEAVVQTGGEEADRFLDRNLATLQAMHGFFRENKEWAIAGEAMTGHLITASQSETPNELTPEEAERFAELAAVFTEATRQLATKSEESGLEAMLLELK